MTPPKLVVRDAINAIYGRINARGTQTALVLRQDPPDIAIPNAGISVESAATWLRGMLPASWRHDVSGEFTQSGATLTMRVRLNGQVILTESASGPNAVDTLIGKGAFKLVQTTEPDCAGYGHGGTGQTSQLRGHPVRLAESFLAGWNHTA